MTDDDTLDAERWSGVTAIFHRARELPRSEQATFLDRECAGKEALRRQVVRLLEADQSVGFLESSPAELLGLGAPGAEPGKRDGSSPESLEPGRRVGPYKVVERIGSGNMGTVYRAEREAPFRMEVALKVVDSARIDEELIWRFRRERQILASLDHPNIARIIDGGTLEDDRPWFALELVDGERIDVYCRRRRLTVRQRLELFRKVCAAVGEAHGLGIVHRDLKPANILVTADGEPKLLDFGIAELSENDTVTVDLADLAAAGSEGTEGTDDGDSIDGERPAAEDSDSTRVPGTGQGSARDSNALTPLYASPEQASRSLEPEIRTPVGVRSDVYALGVVLYELLTGLPPYERVRPWVAVLRSVVREVPLPPSEVVVTERPVEGVTLKSPRERAEERGTDPSTLQRRLRGALDAVVARALEKRPEDRYASVAQLDQDLNAYLNGYPVLPLRADKAYRARLFLRRHALGVGVALGTLWLLVVTVAVDVHGRYRLLDTRELLMDLVQFEEPNQAFPVADLEAAVVDYGDRLWLADDLESFGHTLEERGNLRGALAFFEQALGMRRRLLPEPHGDVAVAYNNVAGARVRLGEFEAAEAAYLEDLEIRERVHGKESLETSRALNNLATLYQDWGGEHLHKARPLLERAEAVRERELRTREAEDGPGSEGVRRAKLSLLATRHNLATQHLLEERHAEAESLFQDVLAGLEAVGLSGVDAYRARVLRNLALARLGLGKSEAAESDAREALRIYRRDLLNWRIADLESILGASLASRGRIEESRFFLEASVDDLRTSQHARSRHAREAEARRDRWLGGAASVDE